MIFLCHCLETMAANSLSPSCPMEPRHPLGLGFLPHLLLKPHGHLPSPSRRLSGESDLADPSQSAHGTGPRRTGGDEAAVPSDYLGQQVLGLLAARGSAEVSHSCLDT